MNIIEIKNLKKYYGTARGIEDVSFEVREKEIFGFVGPNGAGKTTLLRILVGLINKTSGFASILGFDAPGEYLKINEVVGYLPSEANYYKELKVFEQLKIFAKIRNANEEKIVELAEKLDLDLNKKISDLSFGNKKKVGIVAALLHSPKVIILDEPTSGLDPLVQQKFFDILEEERQRGATILLSSHILSEVQKVCDRVALIKEGKILFVDELENIKKQAHKKIVVQPHDLKLKYNELKYLKKENNKAIYKYDGDINDLLKYLSNIKFEDLTINNVDLEEIFIGYYKKEGEE